MQKRIIFTTDFLGASRNRQASVLHILYTLLSTTVRLATGQQPEIFFPVTARELHDPDWQYHASGRLLEDAFRQQGYKLAANPGKKFSRRYFFRLSGIDAAERVEHVHDYRFEDICPASLDYLSSFFKKGDIIVGEEICGNTLKCFQEIGVDWINIWVHPVHYLDDILHAISSSNKDIFDRILSYKVPDHVFQLYADYLKVRLNRAIPELAIRNLASDSLLFFGQLPNDISVMKEGRPLSIKDFEEKLMAMAAQYEKIYYIHHPLMPEERKVELSGWLKKFSFIEELSGISTYHLLGSGKFRKAVSISSSVLEEARYFGLETEYLYKPVFTIGNQFGTDMCSIFQSHLHPDFWANILSPVMPVEFNPDLKVPSGPNLIRDMLGVYWGYSYVDPFMRLSSKN